MGKKGGTRRYFSKEYKLSVVKRNIEGESSGSVTKSIKAALKKLKDFQA